MTREIPCKIGDDVFAIRNFKGTKHIMKGKVSEMFFVGEKMDLCIVVYHIIRGYWEKDIFDTYDKAEEYLNANRRSTQTSERTERIATEGTCRNAIC